MRYAIAALIALQALIHLIDVAKEWRLAQVPRFSGATTFQLPPSASGTIGALWLLACRSLLSAAVMLLRAEPRWFTYYKFRIDALQENPSATYEAAP